MAIERTTSIAKIEVISRGGHLACKILRVVESLILVSVLDRFLVHELVSRLYPKQEHKKWNTINHGAKHKQHDAIHGMICDVYACSGRKMMNMAVTWQTKYATGKMR